LNLSGNLISELREAVGDALVQESPYPVVAPRSVEIAAKTVMLARQNQFHVMVVGSGSSFAADFSVLRNNLLAILTTRLAGVERISPFACRVLSGTPVATVVRDPDAARKTIGGLLADSPRAENGRALRAFWSRVRAIEALTADGQVHRVTCANSGHSAFPTATMFRGTRGRLGMITAIELVGPIPIAADVDEAERLVAFNSGRGDPALSQHDLQQALDRDGIFQW
jgi:FAD/FMN-containing dehydrogenase